MLPRIPDDTLVFVFEEDWRLHPDAGDAAPSAAPVAAGTAPSWGAYIAGSSSSSSSTMIPPAPELFEYPVLDKDRLGLSCNDVLEDLVMMCTVASRSNCGDFIWLSWQPNRRHNTRVGWGSTAICLTKTGAASLSAAISAGRCPAGHIDHSLLAWLLREGPRMPHSFLHPPLGNFTVHASTCEPHIRARPNCWDEKWCCPGTRPSQDPQHRPKQFLKFVSQGHPEVGATVNLDDADYAELYWKTCLQVALDECEARTKRQKRERRRVRNLTEFGRYLVHDARMAFSAMQVRVNVREQCVGWVVRAS